MNTLENVKGWLIDLDGTLYVGDSVLQGASEFINKLRVQNRSFRIVSNSTVLSRKRIAEKLHRLNIEVAEKEVFTAASATAELLSTFGGVKCYLVVADDLVEEFKGIEISDKNPDYVVLGDIGRAMSYDIMNKVFKLVMGGSELIALQKNRFFRDADGLQIDAGSFVAAYRVLFG